MYWYIIMTFGYFKINLNNLAVEFRELVTIYNE